MRTLAERLDALTEERADAYRDWILSRELTMIYIHREGTHIRTMRQCEATIDALTPPQTESRTFYRTPFSRLGEMT